MSLEEALREGAARLSDNETARLDARVLLKFSTGFDDAALILNSKEPLTPDHTVRFYELIERRRSGEPVAYITGVKEFWSLEFRVTPDVLIPRDDSECLIEAVLHRRNKNTQWSILDLGVGSGCLLLSLLSEMPQARGLGVDRSLAALEVAQSNARALGLADRARFLASDWARAVEGAFDIVIANPPYIPEGERQSLPVDVSAFEPSQALFAGPDGMADYRAILADAPRLLAPGGLIVFETGADQAGALSHMLAKALPDASSPVVLNDLKGLNRAVLAERKTFTKKD